MEAPPSVVGHRDRSTALIVFGIFEIGLGALCLLLIVLVFGVAVMAAAAPHHQANPRALLPAMGVYLGGAAVCITLGIGSILARRWARALWVCLSAVALCVGALGTPLIWYVLGRIQPPGLPEGQAAFAMGIARVAATVALLIGFVLIPCALLLFYLSPHVKRTCELKDPKERWTDRCPLPVLALSLYAVFLGLGQLWALAMHGAFPMFGRIITGPAGGAAVLAVAAAWLYAARGLYRLERSGWWAALVVVLLMGVANTATLLHEDWSSALSKMGLGADTAAASVQMDRLPVTKWMGLITLAPLVAWLLAVRGYFPKTPSSGAATTATQV